MLISADSDHYSLGNVAVINIFLSSISTIHRAVPATLETAEGLDCVLC